MSENEPELDREQKREKWLTRIADELEKTGKLFPDQFLPRDIEYPQWVENAEHQIAVVFLPAVNLRDQSRLMTARRMGVLIGHACEKAVWMWEAVQNEIKKDSGHTEQTLSVDEIEARVDVHSFCIWYKAMRRLAKFSLCSCVDQSYQDMNDFIQGYSDGFSRKPKTLNVGEYGNGATEIYQYMIVRWRLIETLDSVRKLHEMLIGKFSASRIGDQKRIEKICQRIGLSFRKPGRPKMK